MGGIREGRPGREAQILEIVEALGSSLVLDEVMGCAYPLLARLVPADHGVLCVSREGPRPGAAADYEWIVASLPDAFFRGYPEVAAHDFVRSAVVRAPNVALRDDDMISRGELEENVLRRRAWELGVRVEQVMAVLIDLGDGAHGGLTFYRDRRTPFSDRDRRALQALVSPLARTIRNCRAYRDTRSLGGALERALSRRGVGAVVVNGAGAEIARSELATALIDRWFPAGERAGGGLPALVARAARRGPVGLTKLALERPDADLRVSIERLPDALGAGLWLVEIEERPRLVPVPPGWRGKLTPREIEVASRALSGWERRRIADDLECSEETVKTHLGNLFLKLAVDGRAGLLARARRDG